MDARLDRRLGWALAISLAVHGLALSPVSGPPPTDGGSALRATLRQPAPAQEMAAPAPPAPDRPVAPPLREPVERTYEKAPAALPAASPAAGEKPGDSAPAVASGAQTEGATAASPDAPAPQPPRLNIDVNGLRQYKIALSHMMKRFKRYPLLAREAGWEGRVPLRVTVSEAGVPVDFTLIGSSGFTVLDQAALEMMRLAAGHAPVPESLRGRAFTIDLGVDYSLKDE